VSNEVKNNMNSRDSRGFFDSGHRICGQPRRNPYTMNMQGEQECEILQ